MFQCKQYDLVSAEVDMLSAFPYYELANKITLN